MVPVQGFHKQSEKQGHWLAQTGGFKQDSFGICDQEQHQSPSDL